MNDKGGKSKHFPMPLVFFVALVGSIVSEPILPYSIKSILYAISLAIKEGLIFCLPFVIFSLIITSIVRLGAKALKSIVLILPLICLSNFCNTWLSYWASIALLHKSWHLTAAITTASQLVPAFSIKLSPLVSNNYALISGVCLGFALGIIPVHVSKLIWVLERFSALFFKCLIPIMPLFIIGTVIKLQCDGVLTAIVKGYLPVLLVFLFTSFGLVLLEFAVLSHGKLTTFLYYLKNVIPAVITAFSSMSSAAALPLSIKAAEKNVMDEKNAAIIIPSTVNIHLVGDCFFIPMVALAVMISFGMAIPNASCYLPFAFHFILAKFAVAAVPGGGVLVMLPIMQSYLGLNADMLALVTALYILFDPIITSCNVTGNGAMAIIFDRLAEKLKLNK
ncbi:MAG: dicarboxylate/amino acid:cation symporter [Opitutales bacterium]|nr:dicarboxylate/amino acid:cation symporter [Opitutales bacterium]